MKKRRIVMPRDNKTEQEKRVIVIEVDENGTKAALVVNHEAVEFMSTGALHDGGLLVGRIYVGLVEAVHRNGFAFVDIGLSRKAFLNLNDNKDAAMKGKIKAGMAIAVQITKEPYRDKGVYVTTKLVWHGRYYVIEQLEHIDDIEQSINVSKKIASNSERERLVRVTEGLLENAGLSRKNIIIRTDAENTVTSVLEAELARLAKAVSLTEELIGGAADLPLLAYKPYASAGLMMSAELSRGPAVQEIIVNNRDEYELIAEEHRLRGVKVTFYDGNVFLAYDISKACESARNRQVYLPSGGFIVIDRTEACVVVDVNSGKFSGRKGLEEMALKINIEAARETAKQLRLRNLGGIIIIDFIRMKEAANNQSLTYELKNALSNDPAITVVEGYSRLGLMEMTRKRR